MSATTELDRQPLAGGMSIAPGYEVIDHLRRGNDLDVYDVWSIERGTRCVVKSLRPDRAEKRRTRTALLREGEVLARLTHPHIVRAYETIEAPIVAVVLETLGGQTLGHMIDAGERADTEEVAHLGLQLGSAIRYLHSDGLLHLDLKPSNVIAEAGRAKLIDLSVARPPGDAPAGVGTWSYLAPEQARGGALAAPADVWGIGTVLFEVATGEPTFDPTEGTDSDKSSTWTADERYPQLELRAPRADDVAAVDTALANLIARCLEPEPHERPAIGDLLAELELLARLPGVERRFSS
jgi:serine/threonine protein kinase